MNVDYVLVSKHTNEEVKGENDESIDQDDENIGEAKNKVVWKFVASTTLDDKQNHIAVSYTHLTLPTILRV